MSTEIEVITYEKERLDYFTKLMQKARKRYKRLFEKHSNCGYMSPEYQLLCDAGRKAQFHEDVVEMLEKGNQTQSEGEWISELRERCDWRGKKQKYYQPNSCSVCHEGVVERTPFCPNCGAKMKGAENDRAD
jgi:hypothetical protein